MPADSTLDAPAKTMPGARRIARGPWLVLLRALLLLAQAVVLHGVLDQGGGPPLLPWDKAEHFAAFFGLALLTLPAFPRTPAWLLALLLALEGGLIELVQSLPIVGRDADFGDWAADCLGIAALLSGLAVQRLRGPAAPYSADARRQAGRGS